MWPFGRPTISRELRKRSLRWLLHSTHIAINLPQIFRDGFVDTARGLRTRLGANAERLLHDPRRFEQFAVGLDYINCALTVPNYELLYARSKSAWPVEWVHLALDLKLLEREDTLFSAVSAAQENGRHVQTGVVGLQAMFADHVEKWTRLGLQSSEPTHPQAEVLIKGALPLTDILFVFVSNARTADEVERLAEFSGHKIQTRIEPRLFLWPARLKRQTGA